MREDGVTGSGKVATAAAARLAPDVDHPVHDCFYLALAMQTGYYLSDRILHVGRVDGRARRGAEGRR